MEFIQVHSHETERIEKLSAFASAIVKEHYDPIIGPEQNDYMIEMFQAPHSIRRQIEEGHLYYIAAVNGQWVGFCGIHPDGGKMFLNKLYIHKSQRGHGYASRIMDFIRGLCVVSGLTAIWLRVNRENTNSIEVYRHMGFEVVKMDKADIGGGFYMDDYILELPLR